MKSGYYPKETLPFKRRGSSDVTESDWRSGSSKEEEMAPHVRSQIANRIFNANKFVRFVLLMLICIVATCVLTLKRLCSSSNWCAYRLEARRVRDGLLSSISDLLTDHNVPFWLTMGSALFALRDGAPKVWEKDHDIFVPLDWMDDVLSLLEAVEGIIVQPVPGMRKVYVYSTQGGVEQRSGHTGEVFLDIWTCETGWMEDPLYQHMCISDPSEIPSPSPLAQSISPSPVWMQIGARTFPLQPWYIAHRMLMVEYGGSYLTPLPLDHDLACWLWIDDFDLQEDERVARGGEGSLMSLKRAEELMKSAETPWKTEGESRGGTTRSSLTRIMNYLLKNDSPESLRAPEARYVSRPASYAADLRLAYVTMVSEWMESDPWTLERMPEKGFVAKERSAVETLQLTF